MLVDLLYRRAQPAEDRVSLQVILADDHPMLRHGVRALLERHGVAVVAEASDGRTAAAAAREHHPDIAVLDIMMPLLNGIDAAREIAETCPETQVVLKTQAEEDLVQAIEQVSRGGFYVGGGVSRAVV